MPEVICLGILVADVVGQPVDAYPERGKLVLVDRMELHSGGCAANTGISLGKLGVPTGVIGKVGHDGFGSFLVEELARHGVDTRGVRRDPEVNTSATMVLVHGDAERSFLHYLGANACFSREDVDMELLHGARILHVAGAFLMPRLDGAPAAELLREARRMGLTTSLDTAWDSRGRWMSLLRPCLAHLDLMTPSIEEARCLTGRDEPTEVAQVLLDAGVRTVALKMGERGCYVRTAEREFAIAAFPVDAVDALGAGDAFTAGFLAGVARGWDLEETARFACAVGARCVTALGATTGVGSMEETLRFMKRFGAQSS
jgi:sugar/nucleoside kinase (ribokinase family)